MALASSCYMYGVLWKIKLMKKIGTLSMVLNLTSVRNMLRSNVFSFKLSDVEKVNYDVET